MFDISIDKLFVIDSDDLAAEMWQHINKTNLWMKWAYYWLLNMNINSKRTIGTQIIV